MLCPVTRPMRPLTSWRDHERQRQGGRPEQGIAELHARLGVGGDTAGIVVGCAGDLSGAKGLEWRCAHII